MMSALSLLPPICVFILGFWTKNIRLSLLVGVVAAAFIAADFSAISTFDICFDRILTCTQVSSLTSFSAIAKADHLLILLFMLTLGILIEFVQKSNAINTLIKSVFSSLKNAKRTEATTIITSHCLSIDGYLSCLTVGSLFRDVADHFKIPRIKLAFLIDSMAAPVAVLVPISSFAAALHGIFFEAGIRQDEPAHSIIFASPYYVYLEILPFVIYSITLIATVWFIVLMRIRFGMMHRYEAIAEKTEDTADRDDENKLSENKENSHILDFLLPMGFLIVSCLFLLLLLGKWQFLGGDQNFFNALRKAPMTKALFLAGVSSVAVSSLYYNYYKKLSLKQTLEIYQSGVKLMFPAAIILVLSWSLGGLMKNDLKTGHFIASFVENTVPINWLPLFFFWNASLVSLALGSSWATAALLIPIATPMIISLSQVALPANLDDIPPFLPTIGAILSGAVFGDHVSLASDTTVLSSSSTGSDILDHVKSQLMYAVPVFFGTSVGFFTYGYLITPKSQPLGAFTLGGVATITSLTLTYLFHLISKRRENNISLT